MTTTHLTSFAASVHVRRHADLPVIEQHGGVYDGLVVQPERQEVVMECMANQDGVALQQPQHDMLCVFTGEVDALSCTISLS